MLTLVCCVAATLAIRPRQAIAQAEDPPAPDAAMRAFKAVDSWVRAWKVPDTGGEPCLAASVILRMDGQVMGKGMAVAAADKDRAVILTWAARQALAEAEPKLGVPRDALYDETLKDVARRLTVSVQLAGGLIPITPKDGAEAAVEVAPGLEGVAARLGDRIAVNFPERMLIAQTEPGAALASLVALLANDPSLAVVPLGQLAKEHGAVYYRLKVVHLAQAKGSEAPSFLDRCGRLVPRALIDQRELARWEAELADVLMRHTGPAGEASTLDPCNGVDMTSDTFGQGVAAFALMRYSTVAPDERQQARAKEKARMALRSIVGGEKDIDLPTKAVCAVALHEEKGKATWWTDEVLRGMPGWRATALKTGFVPDRGFDRSVPLAGQGLVAWLYVRQEKYLHAWGTLEPPDTRNVDSVEAAMRPGKDGALASQMPWLGWAIEELEGDRPLLQASSLRDMRAQLWKHQLQPDDLPPDQQDLAGGIVFTTSKNPMPTWQMARPLAFVATMLGDPRLTKDEEVPAELSRLLLSLRFLRQLTAGEAESFMYRDREKAIGAVRASLWDQRMPPEATAMTLMAACETLRSLDEIQKRRAGKEEKP